MYCTALNTLDPKFSVPQFFFEFFHRFFFFGFDLDHCFYPKIIWIKNIFMHDFSAAKFCNTQLFGTQQGLDPRVLQPKISLKKLDYLSIESSRNLRKTWNSKTPNLDWDSLGCFSTPPPLGIFPNFFSEASPECMMKLLNILLTTYNHDNNNTNINRNNDNNYK